MTRQAGNVIENRFIKGLITETTALNFPTDACTETWNCVFDETGRVTRRLGIDLEEGYAENTAINYPVGAETSYLWSYVGDTSEKSFLVHQRGSRMYICDVSDNTTPSANQRSTVILLHSYAAPSVVNTVYKHPCQYTQGLGTLFVVHQNLPILYITYDDTTDTFTVNTTRLQYRDFAGLDDGLAVDERPSYSDAATMNSTNPEHHYNLRNQGWYRTDGSATVLNTWDTARTDMPSNADVVGYFRQTVTDTFDTSLINQHDPGNTPAPKGHFILTVGEDDRQAAMTAEGFTGLVLPNTFTAQVVTSDGTPFNGGSSTWDDTGNMWDMDTDTITNRTNTISTPSYYHGIDLGASGAEVIDHATIYRTAGVGSMTLYGSNSSPANGTDGTALSSAVSLAGTSTTVGTNLENTLSPTTAYRYVWVNFVWSVGSVSTEQIAEIELYAPADQATINPTTVAFMGGRLFYSGYKNPRLSANIYFTQVIEDEEQYNKCYQKNDPTSDEIADLLATDGGVIKIPEMGAVQKLFAFQNQVLILANNGVWLIKGGTSGGPFAATGYSVSKISSIGSQSPLSAADVKGLPVWWAEDGVYTVTYDPNYDSTTLQSLTEDSIKSFILAIPAYNREYVQATYDRLNDTVYWMYSDSATLSTDTATYNSVTYVLPYRYNKILCFNVKSRAWYPWEFTTPSVTPLYIKTLCYVQSVTKSTDPGIKFAVEWDDFSMSYAEAHQTSYKDWEDWATLTGEATDEKDYTSWFKAGYRLDTEGARFLQGNYIYTFMDNVSDSSLYVRGLYQFSNSGNSGKWSTAQQVYNSKTTLGRAYMDVKISRVKIRGKGQALQLYYYSQTGKPFSCIGWNLFLSSNNSI